jgi:hypothetical protein
VWDALFSKCEAIEAVTSNCCVLQGWLHNMRVLDNITAAWAVDREFVYIELAPLWMIWAPFDRHLESLWPSWDTFGVHVERLGPQGPCGSPLGWQA